MSAKSIKLSMTTSSLSLTGSLLFSASRFDVLIKMKNIFRIVASFDLHQALIIGSVSRGDALALLCGHKVYISAGGCVRRTGFEKLSRPPNTLLGIRGFIPSPVHVQHEPRIPLTIGHCVSGDAVRRTGNQSDENLALRGGELPGELDNGIQRSVGKLREIMRLPIVSRARRQQRVKGLLPLNVGLRADMLAESCAESAQRSD